MAQEVRAPPRKTCSSIGVAAGLCRTRMGVDDSIAPPRRLDRQLNHHLRGPEAAARNAARALRAMRAALTGLLRR